VSGGTNPGRVVTRWALALLVCLATAALTASTAAAASLPAEGIFDNCRLDAQMSTCVQRLQVMHQGGMRVVVISSANVSPTSLAEYAASAHSLGMSVMWELSDPRWWQDSPSSTSMAGTYAGFASACGCSDNGPLLAYLVSWLGQLPGTYGYYAADDTMLSPGDQGGVARYVAEIKQQDASHTVMIGSADASQTSTYEPISDVVGTEIYPFTTGPTMPVSANAGFWDSVGQWASGAQQAASGAGKQSAFILQAFTWGDNLSDGQIIGACSASDTQGACYAKLRYPSAAEQLQLRNEILRRAHPKLILWWSFPGTDGDVTGDTYSIYPSGAEAAARWSGLVSAVEAPYPGSSDRTADRTAVRARFALVNPVQGKQSRHHGRRHRHHRRHRRRHHA
jgi:hypothetical protein